MVCICFAISQLPNANESITHLPTRISFTLQISAPQPHARSAQLTHLAILRLRRIRAWKSNLYVCYLQPLFTIFHHQPHKGFVIFFKCQQTFFAPYVFWQRAPPPQPPFRINAASIVRWLAIENVTCIREEVQTPSRGPWIHGAEPKQSPGTGIWISWVDAALIKLKTHSRTSAGYRLYVCTLYTPEIYISFFCYLTCACFGNLIVAEQAYENQFHAETHQKL